MVIAVVVLLTALFISGTAAFYSIVGLMAIFHGAAKTVAVMGTALEIGKLVTASWLYHFWDRAPVLLRMYLTAAVVVLMFITSMGIFGYLSKAHLSQINPADETAARIEKINFDIAQQQKKIDSANHILERFDQALEEFVKMGYVTRALREREKQTDERVALQNTVKEANVEINKLVAKRFELQQSLRSMEVEFGPVKYIAEMIYGEQAGNFLDKAVRIVIIILIFVFDPLAVLLVVAGNMSIRMASDKRAKRRETLTSLPPAEKAEARPEREPRPESEPAAKADRGPIDERPEEEILTEHLLDRSGTPDEENRPARRRMLRLVKDPHIDEKQGEELLKRVEEAADAPDEYSLEKIFSDIVTEMDDKKPAGADGDDPSSKKKHPVKKSDG